MKKNQFYEDSFSIPYVRILNSILAFLLKNKAKVKKIEFSERDKKKLKKTLSNGALIACNHPTDFDPPSLYCALRKLNLEFRIMTARDVMSRTPYIFRKLIQMGGCFSIDRTKLDRKSLSRSIEILSSKKNLIVFPEGRTHGQGSRLLEYQPGPIKIATLSSRKTKSSIKILPIAIYYSIIGDKDKIIQKRLEELEKILKIKADKGNDIDLRISQIVHLIIRKLEKQEGYQEPEKKYKKSTARWEWLASRIQKLCKTSIKNIEIKLKIRLLEKDTLSSRVQKAREANDLTKNKKEKNANTKKILMLHSLSSLNFKNWKESHESIEEILAIFSKEIHRLMDKKHVIKTEKKCHFKLGKIIEVKNLKHSTPSSSKQHEKKLLNLLWKSTWQALNELKQENSTIIK